MTLYLTEQFNKGYKKLPLVIQKQVDKKLALFVNYGPTYTSLRFKIFKKFKKQGIYELSVTKNYRILLHAANDNEYYALRVGTHDILEKFIV